MAGKTSGSPLNGQSLGAFMINPDSDTPDEASLLHTYASIRETHTLFRIMSPLLQTLGHYIKGMKTA